MNQPGCVKLFAYGHQLDRFRMDVQIVFTYNMED